MPGSLITANLSAPYITPWSAGANGGGGAGTWADSTNSTFTVTSHPFTTGDVMYVRLFNPSGSLVTTQQKYYAIVVSATQLKYASSLQNALDGNALAIPSSLWIAVQNAIGNHPFIGYSSPYETNFYRASTWIASAKSLQGFSVTESVQIDFALSSNGGAPISVSMATESHSYVWGFFQDVNRQSVCGEGNTSTYTFADSVQNTQQLLPATIRFTLQNRRLSTAIKLINGSYVTRRTGSLLSTSLSPLYLYINMGMNGYNINNCTLTYL